jgi:salicylate hydroxylase
MSAQDRMIIVGGGIGGLAAARALSLAGRPSIVIERSPEFSEIGAGIQLGPNGFRALEFLGVRGAVEAKAVFPDNLVVMDGLTADEITRISVGPDFRQRFGYPYALVHRADLHRALLDACEADPAVELRSGATVSDFSETGDQVSVVLEDGTALQGAALVGADGLWSKTRQALVGDGAPRVSGHIAYRAVLPIEDIEERYRHNAMMLWAGPRNHLVQYPLRGGKLFNLVAVFHSDRYVEGWDRQGDPEELHRRFAGNCEVVRDLLAKVDAWRMWVLCDREPVKDWSSGRATLLGDAAHPMLQYLAQGAGMAMEDAVVLARCVGEAGADVAGAFRRYQAERYLRTGRCQILARIYGGFFHAEDVAAELRTGFLRSRDTQDSHDSLAWLYDFDCRGPSPALP